MKKKGEALVLISAVAFALATVLAKMLHTQAGIPAIQITLFRFGAGFVFVLVWVRLAGVSLRPNKTLPVVMRAIFNTCAVMLFFISLQYTTVTNANMLNMAYPVFVVLFSPFINRERVAPAVFFWMLLIAVAVWMIIRPGFSGMMKGDLIALASAVAAGIAVSYLREARKSDKAMLIMFYLMLFGLLLNIGPAIAVWKPLDLQGWLLAMGSAVAGVGGQIALTVGYRHVRAAEGSMLSSSRVLWAMLMGWWFFSETPDGWSVAGASLLVFSLAGISGFLSMVFRRRTGHETAQAESD